MKIEAKTGGDTTSSAKTDNLMRARSGPLTSELVQRPGEFGLGRLPTRLAPTSATNVVCGFCSTGCGLTVHLRDDECVNVTPATAYHVNRGMACPKGWEVMTPLAAEDRATTPYLRGASGELEPVSWETALETFCTRMREVQNEHGMDSVAFLSTGQIPTEEMALLGAFAKFGMGIKHGDGNTRQCMATSVVAYKQAFGFDAPPYTYRDFEESDVIVLVGANPCIAHPIMWQRVLANRHNAKIVVIDPRNTETASAATHHYPLKPKSDLKLFYAVANRLIENEWIDHAFVDANTEDFDAFANHVSGFSPEKVASDCGLEVEEIDELVGLIAEGKRVSFWWTMGVNQGHEAVRTAQSIINIALLTGNIGRPGTGANSITGQTNAMGSRMFSNTVSLFGGRDFTNEAHRREVAEILDIDASVIPDSNSLAYDEIIQGIREDNIKGLWVVATNPGHSWIDRTGFDEDVLAKLDFLVVQDLYHTTDTATRADLVLPAAGSGEKEGTVINSERRIGLYKRVSKAPGEALADFYIFKLLAEAWGCGEMFEAWESPEATFQILKRLSKGRPCDFSGIDDYAFVDRNGGVQWPLPEGEPLAAHERRLFEDGRFFTKSGKAKFCFEKPRPVPEPACNEYPLWLLTGRGTSAQWHTNTRTGKSAVLRKLYPATAAIDLHPDDAHLLGLDTGDDVSVESRRGHCRVKANVTRSVQPGQAYMALHYEETNLLTYPAFDPYSHQPAYKSCAVRVRRAG